LALLAKKAIILLSGGLDSATVAAMAMDEGYDLYALSFRYGQRHSIELDAAKILAKTMGIKEHRIIAIDIAQLGGSALTTDIEVPKGRDLDNIDDGIPITYVPARNTIFLSYALAYLEVLEAQDIFIGVTAVDYSGYPDCRPEYIASFQAMANLATKMGTEGNNITIHTPLIDLGKDAIIKAGMALGVDYSLTRSCYDPDDAGLACGQCDSCLLRAKGFQDAGIPDPTSYQGKGS
jgi:7-cyano-7-deazaguanine synthase